MNSKEILMVADAVSNEKGLDKGVIFEAIESALATATRKFHDRDNIDCRVSVDQNTGEYETFRVWTVLEEDDEEFEQGSHMTPDQAREKDPGLELGGAWEEKIDNVAFGRIAAQTAKQVIVQKVREAEREIVIAEYIHRVGELVNGTVKKVTRDVVIVDLGGNAEACLPRDQMIPRESFRMGDRLRALLMDVRSEQRGPQLFLSRTSPEMLIALFKIEVPEISEQVIEIRAAARDPGSRAKIVVSTNDGRIDPVGACVGMRGSRVQVVSNELASERIDIIPWDDNPAQLVINSMAPAEVASVIVDEEKHTMDIAVEEENLAQAIGRNGQNVRLSSELTGWTINVMSVEDAAIKQQQESTSLVELFTESMDVDDELAEVLVQEGFTSLEEIAYVPLDEILAIDGFDEEIADELRNRAKDALVTRAIASQEDLSAANVNEDLLTMEGMDDELALQLARKGILSMEELAEQSIDELIDIEGLDEQRAGELIMTARAPWFAEGEAAAGGSD
ncbi:MAG: transcription termination/antitermination protein NusA [Gammaproteobacteria bacterium]|nr:transcription termination/antitermination protein NusA [Gammaproteobacteria bacterium]MYL14069.1 transcription termination/antitermination protein NusA [Gammaproteobacteria bacterium]